MRQLATAPGFGLEAMMASRLGLDERGTGGGIPAVGAESDVAVVGRFEGTKGGAVALLSKPISNADRRGGGGAIALLFCDISFEACLCGRAGTGRGDLSQIMDCLGGNDGRAGTSVRSAR